MSYILCGTPRTGSTLLSRLLSSTAVLGRPESYFREPDEADWARRFGLAVDGLRVRDYDAFVSAVRAAGTTENGVFAARVMWGSLDHLLDGLGQIPGESDRAALERALGPLRFVFLRRLDTIGQAVSWSRAEQTGFWQDGDVATTTTPRLDLGQLQDLLATIGEHNNAWQRWFTREQIEPCDVTYEELVQDPRFTVERIATSVGVSVAADWRPKAMQRKQADGVNAEWASVLRNAVQQ